MQMQKTLTWKTFLDNARNFIEIEEKLDDSWDLIEKDTLEGNTYLVHKQKLKCKFNKSHTSHEIETFAENVQDEDASTSQLGYDEIIQLEYHVIYSISYQVPILYFRGYKRDGSLISLEEAWDIFTDPTESNYSKCDMLSILTQMEHPILFKPFLALHPCKTSEILGNTPHSKNFIITFLSAMGPFIRLKLNNNYGMFQN